YVGRGQLLATGHGLSRYDVFQATGTQTILTVPFWLFGTGRAGMWAASVLWASLSSAAVFFSWRLIRAWLGAEVGAAATALVALWNSAVADTPTLFSQNAGFVFFEGQCNARLVTGGYASRPFQIGSAVRLQRHSGHDFAFPGTPVYDQGFFFRRGFDCMSDDG